MAVNLRLLDRCNTLFRGLTKMRLFENPSSVGWIESASGGRLGIQRIDAFSHFLMQMLPRGRLFALRQVDVVSAVGYSA